jgi:hypothetical protein
MQELVAFSQRSTLPMNVAWRMSPIVHWAAAPGCLHSRRVLEGNRTILGHWKSSADEPTPNTPERVSLNALFSEMAACAEGLGLKMTQTARPLRLRGVLCFDLRLA